MLCVAVGSIQRTQIRSLVMAMSSSTGRGRAATANRTSDENGAETETANQIVTAAAAFAAVRLGVATEDHSSDLVDILGAALLLCTPVAEQCHRTVHQSCSGLVRAGVPAIPCNI